MSKTVSRKIIIIAFISAFIIYLYPTHSFCEIQIITHAVKQPFGGSQSPDDARIAAVAKAKREALELAGTYVESTTIVKNAQVEKDVILALTAGVLKAEVISQKNYTTDDAFGIEVSVRVEVDTSVLEKRLKKVLDDKPHLEQLKQARAREKELLEKIALLEKENQKPGKSAQKAANLKKEFQAASRGLTAVEWFRKALFFWIESKEPDLKKALECLNQAIKINPDYADAYFVRALTYHVLGQQKRTIKDASIAIRLKPDDGSTYFIRGSSYNVLKQYKQALQDFNEAIRIEPDNPMAYVGRGKVYNKIGQHRRAIQDYDEAIRLKPDYAEAYLGRGIVYEELGEYDRAIQNYNETIRLKSDYWQAYFLRGFDEIASGNPVTGCQSLVKACELGQCGGYETAKQRGDCPPMK